MKKFCLLFAVLAYALCACAQGKMEDTEIVDIENAAVQAYFANNNYAQNPGTASVIMDYKGYKLPDGQGDRTDWPAGKYISWRTNIPENELAEIRITMSENPDFSDGFVINPDSKLDTCYVLRNMLPDCLYIWKVEAIKTNGDIVPLNQGRFVTRGQLRMIQVRGARNVRDIGGWSSAYGGTIRYGRMYRSASLDAIKSPGRQDFVDNLGVMSECDLRGSSEKRKYSRLGEDKDYLATKNASGSEQIKNNTGLLVKDLRWLIERMKEGKNVNWHCAIGCDRCGTLSFLIEGLLGMSEMDLGIDYELSTLAWDKYNRFRKHMSSQCKLIRTYGDPGDDLATCFYKYWRKIGMSESELDWLIDEMIEK